MFAVLIWFAVSVTATRPVRIPGHWRTSTSRGSTLRVVEITVVGTEPLGHDAVPRMSEQQLGDPEGVPSDGRSIAVSLTFMFLADNDTSVPAGVELLPSHIARDGRIFPDSCRAIATPSSVQPHGEGDRWVFASRQPPVVEMHVGFDAARSSLLGAGVTAGGSKLSLNIVAPSQVVPWKATSGSPHAKHMGRNAKFAQAAREERQDAEIEFLRTIANGTRGPLLTQGPSVTALAMQVPELVACGPILRYRDTLAPDVSASFEQDESILPNDRVPFASRGGYVPYPGTVLWIITPSNPFVRGARHDGTPLPSARSLGNPSAYHRRPVVAPPTTTSSSSGGLSSEWLSRWRQFETTRDGMQEAAFAAPAVATLPDADIDATEHNIRYDGLRFMIQLVNDRLLLNGHGPVRGPAAPSSPCDGQVEASCASDWTASDHMWIEEVRKALALGFDDCVPTPCHMRLRNRTVFFRTADEFRRDTLPTAAPRQGDFPDRIVQPRHIIALSETRVSVWIPPEDIDKLGFDLLPPTTGSGGMGRHSLRFTLPLLLTAKGRATLLRQAADTNGTQQAASAAGSFYDSREQYTIYFSLAPNLGSSPSTYLAKRDPSRYSEYHAIPHGAPLSLTEACLLSRLDERKGRVAVDECDPVLSINVNDTLRHTHPNPHEFLFGPRTRHDVASQLLRRATTAPDTNAPNLDMPTAGGHVPLTLLPDTFALPHANVLQIGWQPNVSGHQADEEATSAGAPPSFVIRGKHDLVSSTAVMHAALPSSAFRLLEPPQDAAPLFVAVTPTAGHWVDAGIGVDAGHHGGIVQNRRFHLVGESILLWCDPGNDPASHLTESLLMFPEPTFHGPDLSVLLAKKLMTLIEAKSRTATATSSSGSAASVFFHWMSWIAGESFARWLPQSHSPSVALRTEPHHGEDSAAAAWFHYVAVLTWEMPLESASEVPSELLPELLEVAETDHSAEVVFLERCFSSDSLSEVLPDARRRRCLLSMPLVDFPQRSSRDSSLRPAARWNHDLRRFRIDSTSEIAAPELCLLQLVSANGADHEKCWAVEYPLAAGLYLDTAGYHHRPSGTVCNYSTSSGLPLSPSPVVPCVRWAG